MILELSLNNEYMNCLRRRPMRKFKFQYDDYWEVVEFENDVTEEEIEEEYQQWLLNHIDSYCGWEEIT